MTTTGRITEFALPPDPSGPNLPGEIVAGPDGAMWFTESGVNKIGRIDAGPPDVGIRPAAIRATAADHDHQEVDAGEEGLPGAPGAWSADRAGAEEAAAREVQVPRPRQGPSVLDPPARRGAHPRDRAGQGEANAARPLDPRRLRPGRGGGTTCGATRRRRSATAARPPDWP